MRRILIAAAIIFATVTAANGQTPVVTPAVPAQSFVGEGFCFPATLTDVGAPGYGPYLRVFFPPGVTFTGATWLGAGVTATTVGVFPVAPGNQLIDPLSGQAVDPRIGAW